MSNFLFFLLLILGILTIFMLIWRLYFLRNPKRNIPHGPYIISPADGRIIEIIPYNQQKIESKGKSTNCDEDLDSGILITIFLSLFDVHYQRAPVKGKVVSLNYIPGGHFPALFSKAKHNERNEIIICNEHLGEIKIIQIAGILARRIKCFVNKGDQIIKGQIIGHISFGSRVSFYIPKVQLKINKGMIVKAGQSIIAEY